MLDLVAIVSREMLEEQDRFRAYFEEKRPILEANAAAGDRKAAKLLAQGDEALRAELRMIPNPDKEDSWTLAWVLPDGE